MRARTCSTSEAYHQYQRAFLVQVKCIISMNKIQRASKAHHQILEKGGTNMHCTIHWPDISCF